MSWSLTASGHVASQEEEAKVIEAVKQSLKDAGASYASIGTQYHGVVNLLSKDEDTEKS